MAPKPSPLNLALVWGCGIALGLFFASEIAISLGYGSLARVLVWPSPLVQALVPVPNIGTAGLPIYRETPLHIAAWYVGAAATLPLYVGIIYALLMLDRRQERELQSMRFNSFASALLWFWGVLVFLIAFVIGYHSLVTYGSMTPLLPYGAWGVAFCVGGFALPDRRWGVRWWGSALCAVQAFMLLPMQVVWPMFSLSGAAINIAALFFILASWRVHQRVQP